MSFTLHPRTPAAAGQCGGRHDRDDAIIQAVVVGIWAADGLRTLLLRLMDELSLALRQANNGERDGTWTNSR